jgi:carbon starvation protein
VARYAIEELVLSRLGIVREARSYRTAGAVVTALICFARAAMVWSGSIMTLWPMFGVANQLLAALALAVGTTVVLEEHRDRPLLALVTAVPFAFMLVTTTAAVFWNVTYAYLPKLSDPIARSTALWDGFVSVFLWGLIVVVTATSIARWIALIRPDPSAAMQDGRQWAEPHAVRQ